MTDNCHVNSLLPEDASVHRWYRSVLAFPPHLVRHLLSKFAADETSLVLDPFCGTGTTPVECKKSGVLSIGTDSNHMAYFASRTKVSWDVDPEAFLADAIEVSEAAAARIDCTERGAVANSCARREGSACSTLRDLTADQWTVLSRAYLSPMPLHKTLVLLDAIRRPARKPWSDHQELALAKALVSGIGNVVFGPEISATAPKEDAPVVSLWLQECEKIYRDLEEVPARLMSVRSHIFRRDSRLPPPVEKASIDFVITSPPYPNEKDYTRATRLESVVLGFIRNRHDLREVKRGLLGSNTRTVFSTSNDDKWVRGFESVTRLAQQIEERRIQLNKTSGFERLYHRVVLVYFGGMKRHLEALKPALRPGARLAYVIGDQKSFLRVPIRTGQILAEIADSLGYRVESIDLWRTRRSTTTRERLKEEVLVLSLPSSLTA